MRKKNSGELENETKITEIKEKTWNVWRQKTQPDTPIRAPPQQEENENIEENKIKVVLKPAKVPPTTRIAPIFTKMAKKIKENTLKSPTTARNPPEKEDPPSPIMNIEGKNHPPPPPPSAQKKLAPIFDRTKNSSTIKNSKENTQPKVKVPKKNSKMTAPKGHEKERQSLGLSMRKFLLGTTANNPISTDSANKPQYLGQTTMRDGASNPQEKADIAAPKHADQRLHAGQRSD